MAYIEWVARHPQAAAELHQLLQAQAHYEPDGGAPLGSEAYAQQQARLSIARQGGMAWRNNVGATKSKEGHTCPRCSFSFEVAQTPIRWGLANDSAKLNAKVKSSDLIGIVPRLVTPEMVGSTIGQFLSVETKKQGWTYTGNAHEVAQLNWLELIASKGGLAAFSTGGIQL